MSAKTCAVMDIKSNPWFMLFVLFPFLSLKSNLSHGADTISATQSLSGEQTLISAGGVFELGFFKPGNSSNFYIGMWYKQVSLQTVVWVANRETPISDKYSSELKILNGNLVLLDESQTPIWSTNVNYSATSKSIHAVLNDTGNFILRDGSNSTEPLWQSFDYPADSWLPGAKLGWDNRTKINRTLTSWKNSEDPAPGLFSIELDPNGSGQILVLWNKSVQYWTTGTWDGLIFSNVPEMRSQNIFFNYSNNYIYVSNENESYFFYYIDNYDFFITRFTIAVSGQLKQWTLVNSTSRKLSEFWVQPRQFEVYAVCGTFGVSYQNSSLVCSCLKGFEPKLVNSWNLAGYSDGCVRKTPLQCGNNSTTVRAADGERDRFLAIPSMGLPEHPQSIAVESAMQCELACLNNCSCTAYDYDSNGCSIWVGDLMNLRQRSEGDSIGKTLYVRLAASEFPSPNSNTGIDTGIVVGSVAGAVTLLGILFVVFLSRRGRSVGTKKVVEGSLVPFSYKDLKNVTKNFSEKLGGGGFGSVFKGTLSDSTVIAVKKLESISQGDKQFRTEVRTIGTIQHVNLVRFRGFCSEGTKKLLVYDYMPNGSLDAHLFHEKDSKILDWKTRYLIALGIAKGLVYLHEKCRDCIIHCDIKPENILLDVNFCPKVADFGLAKLVGREFSRVLTTMRGTRGYLAPEWISGTAISAKADVYSYGMMLFELISGQRNSQQSEDGRVKFFPTLAACKLTEGEDILGLLDHRLDGNANPEEVTRVCKIACWCIQDDETYRPSMGMVVQFLEGVSDLNVSPIPRSLLLFVDDQEHIVFFNESSPSQISQV